MFLISYSLEFENDLSDKVRVVTEFSSFTILFTESNCFREDSLIIREYLIGLKSKTDYDRVSNKRVCFFSTIGLTCWKFHHYICLLVRMVGYPSWPKDSDCKSAGLSPSWVRIPLPPPFLKRSSLKSEDLFFVQITDSHFSVKTKRHPLFKDAFQKLNH